MNEKEQKKIILRIEKELKDFKTQLLQTDKENIFDEYYTIYVYSTIANFIKENAPDYPYTGFPKKNMLKSFYEAVIETDWNCSNDDLTFYMSSAIECNARHYKEENEM